jgi:adenine-specific DNA-methyltransferase
MVFAIHSGATASEAKRTGAHFTPPGLADFLAFRLVRALEKWPGTLRVLDPSCGDGELLRAFVEQVDASQRRLLRMVGVEDNSTSLASAQARLARLDVMSEFLEGDFLTTPRDNDTPTFDLNNSADGPVLHLEKPHVIIANPPYVRTQVLGANRARELAIKYDLRGRVDLYYAFLVAMTEALHVDGLLGVITSNRFLTTRSGESVRQFLLENYNLIEVIDLGDSKLFDAAVLPAIVIAQKRRRTADNGPGGKTTFARVYEVQEPNSATVKQLEATSVLAAINACYDGDYAVNGRIYEVTSGKLAVTSDHREPWRLANAAQTAWVHSVEDAAVMRVGDIAKVKVGIKTTADKIFIRRDWSEMPAESRPESALLRPLYTHFDADKWQANKGRDDLVKIFYPHETVDGKRRPINLTDYPCAARYLESQKAVLAKRTYVTDGGRKWYEIWVPQDPAAWALPKIVFPDISAEPRFFFDETGSLVNGDCYWISAEPARLDLLLLIQGIANSDVIKRYHDLAFNNKLYSGRRRYISQYIERYPVPNPDLPEAREIVSTVRALNNGAIADRSLVEERLNRLVQRAFSVVGT